MFKLAVVHSPVGPQMGPGLDVDIQMPGLEDSHMYSGPRKYDYWDPYGGQGRDHFDETSIDPRRRKRRKKKHDPRASNVAIDFDGTITAAPRVIKQFMKSVQDAGGKCYLVTGRPYTDENKVKEFTGRYGMSFAECHFYPIAYRKDWINWDTLLDVRIGRWKAGILEKLKADVVVDDNLIHIDQIIKHLPDIFVLRPIGG